MAETVEYIESERRRGPGRPRLDLLRTWYSIPHYGRMTGQSRWQAEAELKAWGVPMAQPGGPGTMRRVYVNDLKDRARKAWDSLLDVAQAWSRDAA